MKIIRQGKTAILLAAALFIGLFAIFPAQSLASESVTDRPSLDSENHNAYLVGYEDGTVRPQKAITRAEVCAVINRMLDRSFDVDGCLVVGEMITWTDNQPDAWYYNDIQEATNDHAYDWTIVDGEIVEVWTEIL